MLRQITLEASLWIPLVPESKRRPASRARFVPENTIDYTRSRKIAQQSVLPPFNEGGCYDDEGYDCCARLYFCCPCRRHGCRAQNVREQVRTAARASRVRDFRGGERRSLQGRFRDPVERPGRLYHSLALAHADRAGHD